MNLLAHAWLADQTRTSIAGQILGDMIKGRVQTGFSRYVADGIRLHRAIDSFSDGHPLHRSIKREFEPPLRRYAGILVDIGFDYSLAHAWPRFSTQALADFTDDTEQRLITEWPANAPCNVDRLAGIGQLLASYRNETGIQRALTSVARRLQRANPVKAALPDLLALKPMFDDALEPFLTDLERHSAQQAGELRKETGR